MAAIPDRWNPRLRFRDWLNKPSQAEVERRTARFAKCDEALASYRSSADTWAALAASVMSSISLGASSASPPEAPLSGTDPDPDPDSSPNDGGCPASPPPAPQAAPQDRGASE